MRCIGKVCTSRLLGCIDRQRRERGRGSPRPRFSPEGGPYGDTAQLLEERRAQRVVDQRRGHQLRAHHRTPLEGLHAGGEVSGAVVMR